MTEPFIGEIQIFGFNFAPRGWAQCNGALLSISQNTALFALLGTTYGGNGTTTFALPNLMGRAACTQGRGPGLTPRRIGEAFGEEVASLTAQQMASHQHGLTMYALSTKRTSSPASGSGLSNPGTGTTFVNSAPTISFASDIIGQTGEYQPHENEQPFLATNICIALQGIFPSFS